MQGDMSQTGSTQQLKKMRLSSSSETDPFLVIRESLQPLILQHITGSDVLKMLEVSREWNQLISNSKHQEKKIVLAINEDWIKEFNEEVIKNTNWKYTSLKVNTLLKTRDQIFKVMNNLADSLTCISTRFDFNMNGLKLPKVKSLAIRTLDFPHFFENGLMSSVISLEKLELSGNSPFPEKILECLQSNPGLLELVLENGAENVFSILNRPVDVKLKVLKMNKTDFTASVEKNFVVFLAMQIDSLKELKVLKCDFKLLCKIFNHMNCLKRLTFSPSDHNLFQGASIKQHLNLEELNLILVSSFTLKTFLPNAPMLKKLYISDPTPPMFKLVMVDAPALEEFRYAYFRVNAKVTHDDVIKFYEEEKAKKIHGFNANIKISQI